jgi:hypothetical protein
VLSNSCRCSFSLSARVLHFVVLVVMWVGTILEKKNIEDERNVHQNWAEVKLFSLHPSTPRRRANPNTKKCAYLQYTLLIVGRSFHDQPPKLGDSETGLRLPSNNPHRPSWIILHHTCTKDRGTIQVSGRQVLNPSFHPRDLIHTKSTTACLSRSRQSFLVQSKP